MAARLARLREEFVSRLLPLARQPRVGLCSLFRCNSPSVYGGKEHWERSTNWKVSPWIFSPGSSSPHQVGRRSLTTSAPLNKYYVKPNYLKKWGRRDVKRRALFQEHEMERSNLRLIKKNDILPSAVRKKAAEAMDQLPLNSSITRVRNRCVLTDRGRGIVGRYRVSRMMFRYFAEKGLMAGMQKSQW